MEPKKIPIFGRHFPRGVHVSHKKSVYIINSKIARMPGRESYSKYRIPTRRRFIGEPIVMKFVPSLPGVQTPRSRPSCAEPFICWSQCVCTFKMCKSIATTHESGDVCIGDLAKCIRKQCNTDQVNALLFILICIVKLLLFLPIR